MLRASDDDDVDDDGDDDDDDECRGPDLAQNADTHTLWGQACTVEIHVYMSQATSEEPLYTEIYRKNAGAHRLGPERGHTLCASVRRRNACQDFTRATLDGNLQVKCHRPN